VSAFETPAGVRTTTCLPHDGIGISGIVHVIEVEVAEIIGTDTSDIVTTI
jgi:hypothetical protein